MSATVLYMSVSLDGFIAGPNEGPGTAAEVVIADKAFRGRGRRERFAADGISLLTPDKTRTAANLGREGALDSTRLVN